MASATWHVTEAPNDLNLSIRDQTHGFLETFSLRLRQVPGSINLPVPQSMITCIFRRVLFPSKGGSMLSWMIGAV